MTYKEKLKSFKLKSRSGRPSISHLPSTKEEIDNLYNLGFNFSNYEDFDNIKDFDNLLTLYKDYYIEFDYIGKRYKLSFEKGFLFDIASVPLFLEYNKVNKKNSFYVEGVMVRDLLFENDELSLEDSEILYEAIVIELGGNKKSRTYFIPKSNPTGKFFYKTKNNKCQWFKGSSIIDSI